MAFLALLSFLSSAYLENSLSFTAFNVGEEEMKRKFEILLNSGLSHIPFFSPAVRPFPSPSPLINEWTSLSFLLARTALCETVGRQRYLRIRAVNRTTSGRNPSSNFSSSLSIILIRICCNFSSLQAIKQTFSLLFHRVLCIYYCLLNKAPAEIPSSMYYVWLHLLSDPKKY